MLPGALERIPRKFAAVHDGYRQMLDLLSAILTDGLAAVEAVCAKLLRKSIHSSDVILNIFARRRQPAASITIFADHLACLDLVILDELRSASRPRSSSPPILRSASGERVH